MILAAMVTPNLTLGGAERWIMELITHSDPQRLRWTGVATSGHGGADPHLVRPILKCCPVYANDPGIQRPAHAKPFFTEGVTLTGKDFSTAVAKVVPRADVIVTWGGTDMGHWLRDFRGPRILCSHTTQVDRRPTPISGITHLTGVSKAALGYFDQHPGHEGLPRQVLYNGVQVDRCLPRRSRQEIREEWNIPEDALVLGYIGRQSAEKNYMAAAKAAKAYGQQCYVVYYGTDTTGKKTDHALEQWCCEHLDGRYRLYPPVTHIGDVLGGLDILILASHREAFSLTLIESWLAGVPVIGTPVGSVPELEEQFGSLVTSVPLEPDELTLARAVTNVLQDGEVAKRAQRVAHEHFTVQHMVDRWTVYLEQVVQHSSVLWHGEGI